MLKLNHKERGIAIAALTEAERKWLAQSRELRGTNLTEAGRLESDSIHAQMLRQRLEEEQS